MAPPIRSSSPKRPTPAEAAERFKDAQVQMKEEAAARREAQEAKPKSKRRRATS